MQKSDFYRDASRDLAGPLDGVRVVEATTTWAGPMCGCILGDFGAEVIKVEHPGGEVARRLPPFLPDQDADVSFIHASVNRNKRSLTLDLHRPEGRDLFLSLARTADVVVENFRPGTLARWGLAYEDVRAVKEDVIYVSISGFGQYGPLSDRVGYDPLAQAMSGYLSLNGSPEGDPVKSPTFLADDLGGLHGALAALAALRHRDRTGEGQCIDVALLDSMLFQSNGYLTLGALGIDLPRLGNEFRIAAPANCYACSDGGIFAGVLLDTHWKKMLRVLGREETEDDPAYATVAGRIDRREEVDGWVRDWAAARTVEEAVAELNEAGLPVAPVRSYTQAARDPHVLAREMLQETPQEGGRSAPITGPPAKFSRTPTRVRRGAPGLGQDNDAILDELGVDSEERARLRAAGVL